MMFRSCIRDSTEGHFVMMIASASFAAVMGSRRSPWKHMVIRIEAVVFCKQDVKTRLHVQVLEGIVHQNEVGLWQGVANAPDTLHAVFIYGYRYEWIFLVYLQRLVTDNSAVRLVISEIEPFGATSVTSAEHGQRMVIAEHFNEVFYMGCFAGSARTQVADVDDRHLETDTVPATVPVVIMAPDSHQNEPNSCHNYAKCIS